jgi:outer membrane protein TolC
MRLETTRYFSSTLRPSLLLCLVVLLGLDGIARAQSSAPLPLTLSQAIDLALSQNRTLKLVHLSVTASERKKEIAKSSYFPQIRNESSLLHITQIAGVEIPAGAFGFHASTGLIPERNLIIGQGSLTAYTSGTGLEQPLTQMFKIRESNRAASADIDAAKIRVDQAENEIALRVRQLYYGILIAQLKEQAAAEEVSASQVRDQESTAAVKQGRALDVVALESRAALLDAKHASLTSSLEIRDLKLALNDLLGLPLNTRLQLDADPLAAAISIPSREECVQIAQEHSPEIRVAEQNVVKARAGYAAAKDAYIPDVTGLARYSYQSGVPLLSRNFGTFGFTLSYVLSDGGRRNAEIKEARTLLTEAEVNLAKVKEEVDVQVESTYDKVQQLESLVGVAEELLKVRSEAARLSDQQYEHDTVLASARAQAHAKSISSKASLLEASLGLALAQGDLKRTVGLAPR